MRERGGRGRRATGALANVAVLERELGNVEYWLWKARSEDEREALRARRAQLLRLLDEENARLESLRGREENP